MQWNFDDLVLLLASVFLPLALAATVVHWQARGRRRSRRRPKRR